MALGTLALVTIVLLLLGVPIGTSIAAGLISSSLLFDVTTLKFTCQQLYTGLDSFALLAVPGFMLAGSFMEKGGLSKRLVNTAEKFVGHQAGGFCAVTVGGMPLLRRHLRFRSRHRGCHRRHHDPLHGGSRL